MKKTLLLLASAALLLVGCAKEKFSPEAGDAEMVNMTVSALVQGEELTRAAVDGDGKGVNANRCIMVLYYGDQVYGRYTDTVSNYKATFDVKVPAKRTYKAVFWADYATADGEGGFTDVYYNTADLTNITLKSAYVGNDDKRDAFFKCKEYTVENKSQSFTAELTRPFAQINVISKDIEDLHLASLYPQKVNLSFKAATSFNAMSGECGAAGSISYEADVYKAYDDTKEQLTLSMDYLFAGDRSTVDIDFKAPTEGELKVEHNFSNIPYQRNYRTNIIGNLLTADAHWDVTVDPKWDSKDDGSKDINVDYVEVNKASEVKDAIKDKNDDPTKDGQGLSVTINNEGGAVNDDIIIPDGTPKEKTPEIILDFKKLSAGAQIVIRDEKHPVDQPVVGGANEYDGEVIVIVPQGTTAQQVKILTNKSTVTVRGEYGNVIASCAPQTIIVEKETVIGKLQVAKGNVEVYGKVTSIENITDPQEIVYVYLFQGSTWTNVGTDTNEKLVPLYPVAKIGENYYFTLAEALAAVKAGDVLTLVSDVTLSEKLVINGGKDFTLDLGGKTLTGRVNVDGAKLVVKNGTIKANIAENTALGIPAQDQALNVYGSKDPQYKDGIYTYVKVEEDVILDGSNGALCVMSINGETMYPLAYGVKVDFYGKAYNVPAQVSGNIGYDNYGANIGNVALPAGITAPSKAMSLYGPIVNIYGEMKSSASGNECQAFILSGMARVNVYEGAYLEGSEGFAMKSGNLHVYGGTIKSNGAKKDPVQAVNSGSEASGAAISITSYYTHDLFEDRAKIQVAIEGGDIQAVNNAALLVTHSYENSAPVALKQGVDLAITGGKFTSGSDVPVIFIDNAAEGDAFPMPAKFISGGLYNKAPEAGYIALGKKAEQNSAGLWEIIVDPTVYVVEEMTETMVIPEGVKHVTLSDELAAVRKAENPYWWMTDEAAHNPFFLNSITKYVSLPASMNEIKSGMFEDSDLEEVVFDGTGNFTFGNCAFQNTNKVKKITFKNLPETCVFYDVNDNSKLNQRFINIGSSGPARIELSLPAGWVEKNFQYKFNPCNDNVEIYVYEDGKLIGYSKAAKWYTVTEVNENGVASIIDAGSEKKAIIYAAENTVIPHGVTELVADEAMQNDPSRNYDQEWPFTQNKAVKSVWFPASLLVNSEGKQNFDGAFQHCDNLESITLEGGNDMLITHPVAYWCAHVKTIKIEKLPTSFAFDSAPNDNSGINTYFIGMDCGGFPDGTITFYLPNGWKAAGFQYKFGASTDTGIPTIEVYEADTEGNYQLLGKSVNNVWQDSE